MSNSGSMLLSNLHAFSVRKLREMIFLFRHIVAAYSDFPETVSHNSRMASPSTASTLKTSAPKSARSLEQNGPDAVEPSSSTLNPASGPSFALVSSSGLLSIEASPYRLAFRPICACRCRFVNQECWNVVFRTSEQGKKSDAF